MKFISKIKYSKQVFPFLCYARQLYCTVIENEKLPVLLKLLFCPIITPFYILWGKYKVKEQHRYDARHTFEHKLTLVGIVKNEASYVQEWIEYYRMIGVDYFVIYDNGSTDDTAKILTQILSGGGRICVLPW